MNPKFQSAVKQTLTQREAAMLAVLHRIVTECMDYPPVRPESSDSHLPERFVVAAQQVLDMYGAAVPTGFVQVAA